MSQSPHQIAEIVFRQGWSYGEEAATKQRTDEEGAVEPAQEFEPGKEPPDDADLPAPLIVLWLTAGFVLARIFFFPAWFSGGGGGGGGGEGGDDEVDAGPEYPTDRLFFCFAVASLVSNFALFLNAFLIKHSRDRLLHFVIDRLSLDVKVATALVVTFCLYQAFIFFRKSFRILGLENDAHRCIQMHVLLFSGLVNVWVKLAFDHGPIAKSVMFVHSLVEMFIKLYSKFQSYLVDYGAMSSPLVDMDVAVASFALWQYIFAVGQISLHLATTQKTYDDLFIFWVYLYCFMSIAILAYVLRNGVNQEDLDPVIHA